MNITFIIGNGFDLNLGMSTKYSDMYEEYVKSPSSSETIQKFKNELAARTPYDKWTDFEMGMADYAKSFSSEKELTECVRDFKNHLVQHLKSEQKKLSNLFIRLYSGQVSQELENSLYEFYSGLIPNAANEIIELIANEYIQHNFLTFNYTNSLEQILAISEQHQKTTFPTPIHIHGALGKDVVMGVDNLEQLKEIPYPITRRGQRAFIKTLFNNEYDKIRVQKAQQIIKESSIICTYGWSMGDSDEIWVAALREWIIANPLHHLVCYKYSEKEYFKHNFDEIMEAEDDEKETVLQKLGLSDQSLLSQIHLPIGHNIFNFGKINNGKQLVFDMNAVQESALT